MKTYISETIEIKNINEEKYEMLIEFLEDNKINYEETEYEEYTIDERSEDEKYDDYLWTLSDIQYEEKRMSELEEEN